MNNHQTNVFVAIAILLFGVTSPATAQDDQPTPDALASDLAATIFGEGSIPPEAGEAAAPKDGCSEEAVEVCASQFYAFLEKLDGEATGSGLYSGGQYDIAALMSGAAACEYGDGKSCYLMGTLYSDPPLEGRAPDLDAAVKYYSAACALDYGAGCGAVAYYSDRMETDMSRGEIVSTARKGCMLDDAASCTYYGFYASQGAGMEIDPMLSFAAFMKACDLSSATGCGNIGVLYQQGVFAPQNTRRAASYFDFGCELGDGNSCNAMIGLHAEDGPLPDAEKVAKARGRVCEIKPDLCAE